eukprot:9127867-Pyramimonas_sp.AAC.1
MSNSFRKVHHRHEDAVIVVGAISIGAHSGRAFVVVNIATNIAMITIASTIVDVAMIPRSTKSPTRSEMPSGACPMVSATAA